MRPQINQGPQGQSYPCTRKLLQRLVLLSLLLKITVAPVSAQATTGTFASTSPTLRTTVIPSSSAPSTSQIPTLASSLAKTTTTPSVPTFASINSSDPTNFGPTNLGPTGAIPTAVSGGPLPQGNTTVDRNISQYYYIIIVAAVVILAVCIWLIHLRRRRRKMATRNLRHSALAQDLQGLPSHRRWLHGAWRGSNVHLRGEEGLDERGEAPPPYKSDETPASSSFTQSDYRGQSSLSSDTVSIPLQTYHPSSSHSQKPPEYGHVVRRVDPAAISPEPSSNPEGRTNEHSA